MDRTTLSPVSDASQGDRGEQRELRDERRYLLALRRAMHQSAVPSPGPLGLQRLQEAIDQLQSTGGPLRLRSRWGRWLAALRGRP